MPDLPGYGLSERPTFARSPRDLAICCVQFLDVDGLDVVDLVGFGLGGWIAAELATMAQARLRTATLVGAAGIRPVEGLIHDPMMSGWVDYMRLAVGDSSAFEDAFGPDPGPELIELWDRSREMTARITWKPWMWSLQLPHLLRGVLTPTLLVWGSEDRIVPPECAWLYAEVLAHSEVCLVSGSGHCVEIEQPDLLASSVGTFLNRPRKMG
jgi:pimeloyl-ACP methyl ester carboxylesterase